MLRAAIALVVAGCGAAIPPLPGQGGPAWHELQSEHFTLWTDASVARGRELIRELEHLRQVVRGMAFPDLPTQGRSFVIALRDTLELREYAPQGVLAFAWIEDKMLRHPSIVLAADTDDNDGHVIAHELTHVISFEVLHHQPRWFAEGFAEFFETVNLDPERAVVDVGEGLPKIMLSLQRFGVEPVRDMWACTQLACADARFYNTAWAVMSYLANEHPTELGKFEQRLEELGDDRRAWDEVFPALGPGAIDTALRDWLQHGKHQIWKFDLKLQDWPVTERTLAIADIYATRALLDLLFGRNTQRGRQELLAALEREPTNLFANMIAEGADEGAVSMAEAQKIADAHPDDWRAWWLVARADAHDEAAKRKVCDLVRSNPAIRSPYRCP